MQGGTVPIEGLHKSAKRDVIAPMFEHLMQFPEGYWTGWANYAAWTAIVVNAAGLLILFFQMRLTADAAKAAEEGATAARMATEIALADSRPWLKVEISDGSSAKLGEAYPRWLGASVNVQVENVGRTPALNVRFHWHLLTDSSDRNVLEIINDPAKHGLQGSVIFPGEVRGFCGSRRIVLDQDAPDHVQALIVIEYRSPGGHRHITPVLAIEVPSADPRGSGERSIELYAEVRDILQPT